MNAFFADFSNWLPGMLLAMIVYHLSAYLFTKNKSFLIYSIYLAFSILFIIEITRVNAGLNTEEFIIRYRHPNIWLLDVYLWMLFGWFFLTFLNLKHHNLKLAKNVQRFIIATVISYTLFFLVDKFFFNHAYFFIIFSFVFVPVSLFFVATIFMKILHIKSWLNYFFIIGFLILAIGSLHFFYEVLFPDAAVDTKYHPGYYMMLGMFIEVLIMSLGLGYQYQVYRKQKAKMSNNLIGELQRNERITNNYNLELSHKIEEVTLELNEVAKKAEDYKLSQLQAKFNSEINELKLSSLLSQMNSHFIFNSLNSIKLFIIEGNQKKAAYYLNKFSKLIREILEASIIKEKPLFNEIKTMQLYTTIENIRFNNEIVFEFLVNEDVDASNIMVPPLILHPFIENAIWHGVSPKKGEKIVRTIVQQNGYCVEIRILDNGIGRKAAYKIEEKRSIKRTSFGIGSTRERLQNFYNNTNDFKLEIIDLENENNEAIGTEVVLKIRVK